MSELHVPLLEAVVLVPLLGAIVVGRIRDAERAHRLAIVFSGLTLLGTVVLWQDFRWNRVNAPNPIDAEHPWNAAASFGGWTFLAADDLTAPLLPLIALLCFLTILTTQRTKIRRYGFGTALATDAILLATFSCRETWAVIALLVLGTVPPYLGLRSRGKPTRVYVLYMSLFVALLVIGGALSSFSRTDATASAFATGALLVAVFIRSGLIPFQNWLTDLFEHASFGNALVFVAPMTGTYAAIRLVVPIAPDWMLQITAFVAVATAVYAAGMSLVQRGARQFYCYLFLSHSAMVFVGLESLTAVGLTGALCLWLSASLALGGLGLTLRALEARFGRLLLTRYLGLYEHLPALAICFVLAGLASVGFPGTIGFFGTEMLLDGVVATRPFVGVALLLAMCLNGISMIRAYFILFTGGRHFSTVALKVSRKERFAVVVLAILLIGGGLYPQPGIVSRHEAAERIRLDRTTRGTPAESAIVESEPASLPASGSVN